MDEVPDFALINHKLELNVQLSLRRRSVTPRWSDLPSVGVEAVILGAESNSVSTTEDCSVEECPGTAEVMMSITSADINLAPQGNSFGNHYDSL